MRFLPIVERELRAIVHQSRNWWRRVWTVVIAMVIFSFVTLEASRWATLSTIGGTLFSVLAGFGMAYALLVGPLKTADCLSRERREGTLGLLFLTPLQSYDIVFGKLAATSFETVMRLLGALPVIAIPFLVGGITLIHFAHVALATFNLVFVSLAIGVCVSAFFISGRTSLVLTLAVLLFLTFGFPILGEEVFAVRLRSRMAPFFYMFCPLYTMEQCLDLPFRAKSWTFWWNMGSLHALGWLALGIACWRIKTSWRDASESAATVKWRERLAAWSKGTGEIRLAWRRRMLERNPLSWLEGRDRLQTRLLWWLIAGSAVLCLFGHLVSPRSWPDDEFVILWSLFAHYFVCLWIAVQAPRRFADDKQSGALELLLCTPMYPGEIVRGAMHVLRSRFGLPFVALLALDIFLLWAYFDRRNRSWDFQDDMVQAACSALIVFPVQAWAFARVGLFQGLVHSNSLRATFRLLWKLGVLPWVLFALSVFTWEVSRRHWRFLPNLNDEWAFSLWVMAHLAPCAFFLAHANWQLKRKFRYLAARVPIPWWQRLQQIIQRLQRPSSPPIDSKASRHASI